MKDNLVSVQEGVLSELPLLGYPSIRSEAQTFFLSKENISFEHDVFRNDYGSIRNMFVRNQYFSSNIDLSAVVELYKEWRDDAEYFILRKPSFIHQETFDRDNTSYLGYTGIIKESFDDYQYRFVKASKRGNDVYKYLVSKKLKKVSELDNVTFFKDDWSCRKTTSLLFITLTYDKNRSDVNTAWNNIGKEFHLFKSNIIKQFGAIEFFRTWESTTGYYPHIHCVIAFKKRSFEVFTHTDKDGNSSYRIPKKIKDKIASYWHSFVDIRAVDDSDSAIKELTKYITKDLCSEKGDKTNGMIWLFHKQGYSVSKGFVKLVKGCFADTSEPNSADLINEMCNLNSDNEKWEFVGILRGKNLGFSSEMWCIDLKKPPPRIANLLIQERERWLLLHGSKY